LAVTIVTQFVANLMQSRGKNLLEGLAGLLKQIDPTIAAKPAKDHCGNVASSIPW